ncbi:PEGA domain-containing protein [Methanogenium sp. S4BF]|uniref:PEGA domain-containing protein n=1 Tax=Methanogenium sp. S4BF TaxID=1789226 RepID=UPI0024173286|nr:PEGA domain-containing protein [Methanogenium sp. S4BF]WFN33843.1 PEGA domain-containing protein [Methanogenium sp. S4BF]
MINHYIHECTAPCIVFCLIAGFLLIPAGAGATTWNVSPVAGGEYANVTSLLDIPALSDGDTIRIWGVDGQTFEGGITIDTPDVLITRWEGSPARPLITNTSHTAPAVTVTADNVTLRGLDISNNRLENEDGAGVCVAGTSWDNHLQGFTVTDCVFSGNAVTGNTPATGSYSSGGAIGCRYVDAALITNTTCADNTAHYGGGAYFIRSFSDTVTNTTFTNNTAEESGGGAYFDRSDYATVTNTTFTNNTAHFGGGAWFCMSTEVTVKNSTFTNNTAPDGGGAFFTTSFFSTVTNCLFENDNNLHTIGSVGMTLSEPNLIESANIIGGPYRGGNVWLRDPAQNISEWGADADFNGICDQSLTIPPDLATDSFPLISGGGTVAFSATPQDAFVYVDGVNSTRTAEDPFYLRVGEHCITLQKDGYIPRDATVTVVAESTVSLDIHLTAIVHPMTWNVSPVAGYGNYSNMSLIPEIGEGDTIRIWGMDGHTYEGGITIDTPDVLITRWEGSPARPLITNTSHTAPAVTVTADNVTLRGLDISNNRLENEDGAGVCVAGPSWDNHLQGFTVTDCVFSGNAVTGNTPATGSYSSGGAIGCRYVDAALITNTTCADNTAHYGGGAYFIRSFSATVTNTTFTNNTAEESGGGAWFYMSPDVTVKNSTFTNNTAPGGGGAFFDTSFFSTVTNCLFENDKNLLTVSSEGMILSKPNLIESTNIIGGPYLGGNVWLRDPAQNISEWGADADFDGICDQSLSFQSLSVQYGTDFFPLVYGGTVAITSTPQDAFVYVDGVNTTRTTDASLYLPVGDHQMTVALRGYVTPANRTVTVTAGTTTTLDFDLVRETGYLEVTSVPDGAAIILDGTDTNTRTNATLADPLPTGDYNVTVTLDGYITPAEEVVTITTGDTTTVNFDLVRETGFLEVTSVPAGAHIFLDGTDTHTLTNATLADPLPTGEYNVTVALDGYLTPENRTVTITAGATTSVSFTPERIPTPIHHGSGGGNSGLSAGAANSLSAGDTVSFAVQNSAFCEVNITAGEPISDILITVGRTTLPSGTDAPPGEIYEYDEILLYHTTDDRIADETLNFTVSKTWLAENDFGPGDVTLYRLHDGVWEELAVRLTGEDAQSCFFTAATPGFSTFAIAAVHGTGAAATLAPAPAPAIAEQAPGTAKPATPTSAAAGPTPTQSPVPYGCAVLAAGLICLMKKRRE